MKISVVTPNFNGERFLEESVRSVVSQGADGVALEYIVVDGGSTDGSAGILDRYRADISVLVSEPDDGPADAINKGLAKATGDVLCWLNADDRYYPGALGRVARALADRPDAALCFGHCPIVDEQGVEIRRGITRFKAFFFPLSSRFTIQCLNYVSQPAMFFRREAFEKAGPLRTDLLAAWDYDLLLRLWRQGGALRLRRPPLAAFRWHPGSISGRDFATQFREEFNAACADAGKTSLQALLHLGVRWGIVGSYALMRSRREKGRQDTA